MPRTFLLPKDPNAKPPKPIYGDVDRVLPGGNCPRGMRSLWDNQAGSHSKGKGRPDLSASPDWRRVERDINQGRRVRESEVHVFQPGRRVIYF